MSGLPPLPQIEGDFDLLLDVYTHRSLSSPGTTLNDKYGNTERLALLGREVLELAVTYHYFAKRPCLDMDEIQRLKAEYTSPQSTNGWIEAYGLKEKLRINPPQRQTVWDDYEEMNTYFHIYVGAIYHQSGLQVVQDWISRILDPEDPPPKHPSLPQPQQTPGMSFFNSMPSMQGYQQNSTQYNAPQPTGAPPPLPSSQPPPMSSNALSLVTLALVNQTASQKNVSITYPSSQEGPPHQPLWTVRCCINNVEKGIGRGKSMKAAREEAARQAWAAMGWGPS